MTTGFEGLQQEEIGRAQSAVAKQYAVSRGQQTRRRAGYGLDPSENTQGDFNRSETSAIVAAKNFARERSEQRRMDIISGGLGTVRDRSVLQGVG